MPPGPAPLGTPSNALGPYDGDYNNSGSGVIPCPDNYGCEAVTAADYTIWRNHLNTNFVLPNRFRTLTGNVGNNDYRTWKMNYGKPNVLSMAEPTNFPHLQLEQEWYMWFQPYYSTFTGLPEALDNFAHLYQDVSGTPGLLYTMEGWACFEPYFAGGRTHLNLAGSSDTPPDDGPLSPTDTFFALEFLDATGTVLAGLRRKGAYGGWPAN